MTDLAFLTGRAMLTSALLAVLCLPLTSRAEDSPFNTGNARLSLASAQTIAVRDNPGLAQMQSRYAALSQMPSQMGALPDPVVSFNAMNFPTDTFNRDQEAMTQVQIGISQDFPFPGKLALREAAAEYEAEAARHSVDEMRLRLMNNVSMKWWQVFYLDRALETVNSNQQLLRQFIEVAQKKYEVGNGLQQDVLLAQLELSKLLDQDIQISGMRRNQAIQLNVLMGRSGNEQVRLPPKVSKNLPAIASETALYAHAQDARPLLLEMDQQLEAARSRLSLAEREYYPDFKLGLTYGDRQGNNPPPMGGSRSNFASIMLGVKIPFYAARKQSKAIGQRRSELEKNRYALLDTRNSIRGDISSAVTDYLRAKEQYSLFESGIVPQAQQTVQSMLAGYRVSQVDFLNLVRSQVTLFNYELQYWKALTEANQALARLQAAVGKDSIYE
ncbi:MAG TPA: transporter [Spongiibacteraceae bacterium]|nr:transporter [Spongiibacteraceae bacterium]HCS29353.1 transporter [Spongiibacteraceae bacterium]